MNQKLLLDKAKTVLAQNWTGTFTKPAPNLYPHQWNWDAGFIAIGYAHYDQARAEAELRHLFRGQWRNGMLPQIVFGQEKEAQYFPGSDFWQTHISPNAPMTPLTSGITMPPVHGFVLWRMYEVAKDKERAKRFLQEMYPKVLALHQYLYKYRDPFDEGLCYIRHPWEPGTDNSPTWDEALANINLLNTKIPTYQRKDLQTPKSARYRPTQFDYDRYVYLVDLFRKNKYDDAAIFKECPFLIQDPLFNSILSWSNEALIKIGALLHEDVSDPVYWHELTIHALNEKLWDPAWGIYNAYDLHSDEIIPIETSSGLMPLAGGVPTQEQAEKMLNLLLCPAFCNAEKDLAWFCPTYSLLTDDIDYKKYWRGPVWINMNWLLYHGLKRYDFDWAAEAVKQDSLELMERYGFFEYFDPRKSIKKDAGYGTNQFSWSAALCIDFLSEN